MSRETNNSKIIFHEAICAKSGYCGDSKRYNDKFYLCTLRTFEKVKLLFLSKAILQPFLKAR